MKNRGKIVRLSFLLVSGLIFILFSTKEGGTLFGALLFFFIACISIFIILIITLISDINTFKNLKSISSFIPTILSIVIIVSVIKISNYISRPDNTPILVHAGHDSGSSGCWITFRNDNTYEFGNGSGLGVDITRGKFLINDSIIILDKTNIDKVIKSNHLLIRAEKRSWRVDTIVKFLYQIDDTGIPIKDLTSFIVYKDNRIK